MPHVWTFRESRCGCTRSFIMCLEDVDFKWFSCWSQASYFPASVFKLSETSFTSFKHWVGAAAFCSMVRFIFYENLSASGTSCSHNHTVSCQWSMSLSLFPFHFSVLLCVMWLRRLDKSSTALVDSEWCAKSRTWALCVPRVLSYLRDHDLRLSTKKVL